MCTSHNNEKPRGNGEKEEGMNALKKNNLKEEESKRQNTAQTAKKNRPLEDGNIDIFLSFFSLPVKGWLGI